MKSLLYRVLIFFAALLLTACSHDILETQDGLQINVKNHPGKWLIIHYWAPWCAACKQELPEINAFYLTHFNHVLVYGFDYDQPNRSRLLTLRKEMGIDFPLLLTDPKTALSIKQDIQALPITFIYNPKGQLISILSGPQTAEQLTRITQDKSLC